MGEISAPREMWPEIDPDGSRTDGHRIIERTKHSQLLVLASLEKALAAGRQTHSG